MTESWFLDPDELNEELDSNSSGDGEGQFTLDHPYDVDRFYIGTDNIDKEHRIILLDDNPVSGWFHQFADQWGSFGNWAICTQKHSDFGECIFCDNGYDKKPRFNYSAIDVTGFQFEEDEGDFMRYKVCVLPAKKWLYKKFERIIDDKGTIVGQEFKVVRTGKGEDNCGNDWGTDGLERVDLKAFEENFADNLFWSIEQLPDEYADLMIEETEDGEVFPFLREGLPLDDMLAARHPDEVYDWAMDRRDGKPLKKEEYDGGGSSGGRGGNSGGRSSGRRSSGRSGGRRGNSGGRSGGRRSSGRSGGRSNNRNPY